MSVKITLRQPVLPFAVPGLVARACAFAWRPDRVIENIADADAYGLSGLVLPERLRHAAPRRKAEFLAGRACALLALRELGCKTDGLDADIHGSPAWPYGYIGSISHTASQAIAIVARRADCASLGIDIEDRIAPERARLIQHIIAGSDEARLCPADLAEDMFLTIVFSAKEAFYKAAHPLLRGGLNFQDIRLSGMVEDKAFFDIDIGAAEARALGGIDVIFAVSSDRCLSVAMGTPAWLKC